MLGVVEDGKIHRSPGYSFPVPENEETTAIKKKQTKPSKKKLKTSHLFSNTSTSPPHFPQEIYILLCSFLLPSNPYLTSTALLKDLYSLQLVCKQWYTYGQDNVLWKNICERIFGFSTLNCPQTTEEENWKLITKQRVLSHRPSLTRGFNAARSYITNSPHSYNGIPKVKQTQIPFDICKTDLLIHFLYNDLFLVPYDNNEVLTAFSYLTGKMLWQFKKEKESEGGSGCSMHNNIVYWCCFDALIAIDAANGTKIWEYQIHEDQDHPNDLYKPTYQTPVVVDESIYIIGKNGSLVVLNCLTGNQKYSIELDKKKQEKEEEKEEEEEEEEDEEEKEENIFGSPPGVFIDGNQAVWTIWKSIEKKLKWGHILKGSDLFIVVANLHLKKIHKIINIEKIVWNDIFEKNISDSEHGWTEITVHNDKAFGLCVSSCSNEWAGCFAIDLVTGNVAWTTELDMDGCETYEQGKAAPVVFNGSVIYNLWYMDAFIVSLSELFGKEQWRCGYDVGEYDDEGYVIVLDSAVRNKILQIVTSNYSSLGRIQYLGIDLEKGIVSGYKKVREPFGSLSEKKIDETEASVTIHCQRDSKHSAVAGETQGVVAIVGEIEGKNVFAVLGFGA